jgi:hypothetical protein
MRPVLVLAVAATGLGCSVPNVNFYDASADAGMDGPPPSPFCLDINNGPFPDGSTACCTIGQPCFGRCNPHDCLVCAGCTQCCNNGCCH